MTLQEYLEEGVKYLDEAGIAEAELDARYLLLASFDLTFGQLLARRGMFLIETEQVQEQYQQYRQCLKRRGKREPLQHILGTQEFMGLSFFVGPQVLIPRQDTETLVEAVLEDHPQKAQMILDLCTGTGCIAISLALLGGYHRVVGVDISEEALQIARKNRDTLLTGTQASTVELLNSDLYRSLKPNGQFDMIVSNPPYIPTAVIAELEPEVKNFEPLLALDGKADGLHFYRRIISQGRDYLKSGGNLYLEVGHDQSRAVCQLLQEWGYEEIVPIRDVPGVERVIKSKWSGKTGAASAVEMEEIDV